MSLLSNLETEGLTHEQVLELERVRWSRIKLCERDFEEFCFTYFPNYFSKDPSTMHMDFFREIQDAILNEKPDSLVYAAPRGNAKSTIVSFALPIWCAVYEKKHYIVIVSDASSQANDFLLAIKTEFEENELLIEDFGNQEGGIWTQENIILQSDVRIQALGAGKKIRGRRHKHWRPDLIIGDDLENDENIASEDQRKKMYSWHAKALSKAGDETTDKIFIGTILHYDSLLNKLLNNPTYLSRKYQSVISWSASPLWDEWERMITNLENPQRLVEAREFYHAHQAEMLEGTKVLWEEKEPYYSLMLQRLADGPAAFSSEKQNEPLSDEERRFLPEWIQYYEDKDLEGVDLHIAGAVDPSLGKTGGDFSAIITGGMDTNGIIYILDVSIQRRHPDIIIADIIGNHRKYKYNVFGAETVQFQEYFKDELQKKAAEEGLEMDIRAIKNHSDKVLRIQTLQPDIKHGRVKFKRDQQKLIEQLINFPHADHDDGPDALEMLVSVFGRRSFIADFYKQEAHETSKDNTKSLIQNAHLQGASSGFSHFLTGNFNSS